MDQEILKQFLSAFKPHKARRERLQVDTRLGSYIAKYEKLRNIVGFHDEHAWRRYAIERIIKRQLYLSIKAYPSAEELLQELLLAQYIEASQLTAEAILEVKDVIDKYLTALSNLQNSLKTNQRDIRDWFFGIMAVEIEDVLGLLDHDMNLVEAMRVECKKRFEFPPHYLSDGEIDIFLLIAVNRILIKADQEFIAYFLMKQFCPAWFFHSSRGSDNLTAIIWNFKSYITSYERNPFYNQLTRLVKQHSVIFHVLYKAAVKYRGDLNDFNPKIYTVIQDIYFELQKKVSRQIWHSFLYLLITKLSLVVILELPYELWQNNSINFNHFAANLTSPIILLFALTLGIHVGDAKNTKMIIEEVSNLAMDKKTGLETGLQLPVVRAFGRAVIFNVLFLMAYIISYGGMIYALYRFDFNIISGWLFILFATLVTYLAIRIRFVAERFRIVKPRTSVIREILYFFALPILSSGKWIVNKFSNYNFFLIIFDLLFEAPYKTLIFLFRDFSDFAREKREMIE